MGITEQMTSASDYACEGNSGNPPMKTLLTGIAFALVMAFTSRAFATDLPDCPKGAWKHGHYVCEEIQANS